MKTIIVTTQAELDALPDKFDEFTIIEIRSAPTTTIIVRKARESSRVVARESSRVVARESSHVVAWESSRVVAWESSSVALFLLAVAFIHSSSVKIEKLCDNTTAKFIDGDERQIELRDSTATVVHQKDIVTPSFETWLERGYVVADGIHLKLKSKKKLKDIETFSVEDHFWKESFVVKRGEQFSHGETIKKAIESLRYKLSDRDTSRFKAWKLTTKVSAEDAIQAYRAITGACEFGTRSFCESIKVPESVTIAKVIELAQGKYGNQKFAEFFN